MADGNPATGRVTEAPPVLLHTRTIDVGYGQSTRVGALTIGHQRIELVAGSPIVMSAGPGPSTLTVSLFVGTIDTSTEGD